MPDPDGLNEMLRYYEEIMVHEAGHAVGLSPEEPRLFKGTGILEFARSREIIMRYLAPPPMVVLDVGGGPGAYSVAGWRRMGYEVHLIDPVPRHLSTDDYWPKKPPGSNRVSHRQRQPGKTRGGWSGPTKAATRCCWPMGPLYHLTDADQRRKAGYLEARWVGYCGRMDIPSRVIGVGINQFSGLFDGVWSTAGLTILSSGESWSEIWAPEFLRRVSTATPLLKTISPPPTSTVLKSWRRRSAGQVSRVLDVVAVQGPGWLAKSGLEKRMADPEARERLLALVRKLEREPSLIGVSQHFMVVGRK